MPSLCASKPDGPNIVLTDSLLDVCRCPKTLLDCNALEKYFKRHRRQNTADLLKNFLDSLGFFHSRWDTLSKNRYSINPGIRSIQAAESLIVPFMVDSLGPMAFPTPYDAGVIAGRSAEIGRRLAQKGYPFAAIAVSIIPQADAGVTSPYSLRTVYQIEPDRLCYFATPRLIGGGATKPDLLFYDMRIRMGMQFDTRKIDETIERLNRRPYVESARAGPIAVIPRTMREPGDSGVPREAEFVTVPVLVKDRSGLGVDGALGYTTSETEAAPLQGNVTLSFLNVFHSGENASLVYAGDKTYQKFHVEASKPWFLGSPVTASAAFGLEIEDTSYGFLDGEVASQVEIQRNWIAGLSLKGTETTTDSASWKYYGADFLLSLQQQRLSDGVISSELSMSAGGGFADRERSYGRSHVDFTAGIHFPLWRHQALRLRAISKHLLSKEKDLVSAEVYRIGGYRSARGYQDNQFAFSTVTYTQLEYLMYFNSTGSVYLFTDGGFGFENTLSLSRWNDRRQFLGYGFGVRVPATAGTLTLEWARNIDDEGSLGRIHVRVRNYLAGEGD